MHRRLQILATAAIVGVAASGVGAVSAAEPESVFASARGLMFDLRYPAVADELGLSAEQLARIAELERISKAAAAANLERRKGLTDEERTAEFAKLKAEAITAGYKFDGDSEAEQELTIQRYERTRRDLRLVVRLDDILSAEQAARSRELMRRIIGTALFAKGYRDVLRLSVEQKLVFEEALEAHQKEKLKLLAELNRQANNQPDDASTQATALAGLAKIRAHDDRVLAEWVARLNPQQRELFAQVRGKDFDRAKYERDMLATVYVEQ